MGNNVIDDLGRLTAARHHANGMQRQDFFARLFPSLAIQFHIALSVEDS